MNKFLKLVLAASSLLLITGCNLGAAKKEDPVDNKPQDQVVYFEDQSVDKIIVKDMNIAYYDEVSHIAFDIANENEEAVNYQEIVINYYAEDETLLYSTTESVGGLDGGEVMSLYLYTDIDLTKAKTVTYEVN